MAIDYSVYTVLQASRRSWRIGQTEPVKVYFFAYEETIQEDALHLVAAKVVAALRVNGDTVGDDSLADLDDLTAGDLVATLAKIITGDVQIEARSLQQAFAEANAGLRQANTLIGEYSLVDDDEEVVEAADNGNGHMRRDDQRPLLIPDHLMVVNGAVRNGRSAHQVSLFANGHGQAQTNGIAASPSPNGQTPDQEQSSEADKPAVITPAFTPPTLRPRLLI